MALGLGLAACQKVLSVGFTTAGALVIELLEAHDEKRLREISGLVPHGLNHGERRVGGDDPDEPEACSYQKALILFLGALPTAK